MVSGFDYPYFFYWDNSIIELLSAMIYQESFAQPGDSTQPEKLYPLESFAWPKSSTQSRSYARPGGTACLEALLDPKVLLNPRALLDLEALLGPEAPPLRSYAQAGSSSNSWTRSHVSVKVIRADGTLGDYWCHVNMSPYHNIYVAKTVESSNLGDK